MKPENNPYLIDAYIEYMEAIRCVKLGLMSNANTQRTKLRTLYRVIAGKPLD